MLSARIGAGGMSQVWRAVDEVLGRPVAVKVLDTSSGADPVMRAALRREALAAARLNHPHITQVFDFGEAHVPGAGDGTGEAQVPGAGDVADGGDGVHLDTVDSARPPAAEVISYLVMELLPGQDLARQLQAGALHWRAASRIGAQVAAALAAAHRFGVVHRDIKPANVVLTPGGAKVVDFGIAALGAGPGQRAHTGLPAGTPAFLAPELFGGAAATPASDVYGLGALLHAMLTGSAPIAATTWAQAVRAHESTVIGRELAMVGLPAPVRYLCMRCLARDPHSRPAAHEVAALLESAAARPPAASAASVRRSGSGASGTGNVVPATPAPPPAGPARPRHRGRHVMAVLGGLLMLAGLVVVSAAALARAGSGTSADVSQAQAPAPQVGATGQPVGPEGAGPRTPGAAVAAFDSAVAGALDAQLVDPQVGRDLTEGARDLRERLDRGRLPAVHDRADGLRSVLRRHVDQGELDPGVAADLDQPLASLVALTAPPR